MKPFQEVTAVVAPLMRNNIDTDAIMPKQYLKMIGKTGYGDVLFDDWRYQTAGKVGDDHKARTPNPSFVLNQPRYQHAQLLVVGENFGCGSSREHAVWGLNDFGIRAVLAPSFGDIFYNNAINNGLLPVVLPSDVIATIGKQAEAIPNYQLTVSLTARTISDQHGLSQPFPIPDQVRTRLMAGHDAIDELLTFQDAIKTFEQARRQKLPWLYN